MIPITGHQFAFVLRVRMEVDPADQSRQPVVRGML